MQSLSNYQISFKGESMAKVTKFYTWQQGKKGFCAVVLKLAEFQEAEVKQYCLEPQKKYLIAITLEESQVDSFVEAQEKAIKLTEKSEEEFIALRENTPQWKCEQQALADVKALRLKALNAEFDALIANALGEVVPQTEMLTWEAQERESNAFLNSNPHNESLAPTMVGIATARGVDLEILCQKCIEKSEKYRQFSATMIGKRQRFQDAIESAKTQEEVWNVEFAWA